MGIFLSVVWHVDPRDLFFYIYITHQMLKKRKTNLRTMSNDADAYVHKKHFHNQQILTRS